jgi:hypothetical protein
MDIDSPIEGEWYKDTTRGFEAEGEKIIIYVEERGHEIKIILLLSIKVKHLSLPEKIFSAYSVKSLYEK